MITYIGVTLSIAGAALVTSKYKEDRYWGFNSWIVANMIWLADALWRQDIPQVILWTIYATGHVCC